MDGGMPVSLQPDITVLEATGTLRYRRREAVTDRSDPTAPGPRFPIGYAAYSGDGDGFGGKDLRYSAMASRSSSVTLL